MQELLQEQLLLMHLEQLPVEQSILPDLFRQMELIELDSSGNLTNIGTVSSGAITTTGTETFNGVSPDITTGSN